MKAGTVRSRKRSPRDICGLIMNFYQRQVEHVRKRGWHVLLRKGRVLLIATLVTILAIPVVLVVRALRPFVLLRFRPLINSRLGHFAANTEVYLCERDAGMHGRHVRDIFYYGSTFCCNQQLKKMWERTINICWFAGSVDRLNRRLPGYEKHVIPWREQQARDIHGLLVRTKTHLSFTPEEEQLGRHGMQEIGVPSGTPFICLQSRDSAYLDTVQPGRDWHYHDYLDTDIENFVPAAKELVQRGYIVLRTGAIVKKPLKKPGLGIIDYATVGRNDFLDIYIGARCSFYLGGPSGYLAVPMVFRRPIAIVDMVPLEYALTWGPDDLFIPKKLWQRQKRRFLTFREMFESGASRFQSAELYEQMGLEVVENTPEEITALAMEMDERLKGKWQTTQEDEEMQRRFWSFFKPSKLHGTIVSRIGAEFLRRNRALLE